MDDVSRNPKPFQGEGTCLDVKSFGLNEEDGDYITQIKELHDHLDTVGCGLVIELKNLASVKKLVKPGCSEEVVKVALSSMASLVETLTFIPSTPKLHASL